MGRFWIIPEIGLHRPKISLLRPYGAMSAIGP